MLKTEVNIIENTSNNYDVNISLKSLTLHNLHILEIIFDEFVLDNNNRIKDFSEQEKIENDCAYRVQPSVELLEAIRKERLRLDPNFKPKHYHYRGIKS
jgi:hypothetical protein